MKNKVNVSKRIYRMRDLTKVLGLGETWEATLWNKVRNDPEFPKPIRLSTQSVGWRVEEIEQWLSDRPVVARKGGSNE